MKRVLALLNMEVRELMREANMTDSIRPRSPGVRRGEALVSGCVSFSLCARLKNRESLQDKGFVWNIVYLSRYPHTHKIEIVWHFLHKFPPQYHTMGEFSPQCKLRCPLLETSLRIEEALSHHLSLQ